MSAQDVAQPKIASDLKNMAEHNPVPDILSVSLRTGYVTTTDGQRLPITQYLGPPNQAPDDDEEVTGFNWVSSIIAGPDADGHWIAITITDDDKETDLGIN